jgi:hypothetical protein
MLVTNTQHVLIAIEQGYAEDNERYYVPISPQVGPR